ncbi:MAG TPA: fibronectin type III domain-containing protein [Bacteroidales bacterium]|nr:fibronectin type III domain-containing protein [Bacteroidales bacterium]HOL98238.1 fibronectin type III domain-containing protein [Bacteroidales bacterium]HOM36591.1 fibronectin type III domain-containing protein [Bacteroidales bacterium]HPD24017.1 fibronectin type III domain-containing protein [Bacteroidales bacterium]HRT00032.1 fibronectin type III domain-containing protein [Bacteroidales bacterium]
MKRRIFKIMFTIIFSIIVLNNYSQVNFPDPPKFLSASVLPESNPTTVRISWNPSDSASVVGYIIYKIVGGVTQTIGEVNGRLTTVFDYTQSQADNAPESFRLASFDANYFKSMITDPHKTINLKVEFDKCKLSAKLTWNAYEGWTQPVTKYKIYRRTSEGTYSVVGSTDSNNLSFENIELLPNTQYFYYVEALNNSGLTATSNSVSITTESYLPPDYLYAHFATVENSEIKVKFLISGNTADVSEFIIQRASDPDGNWSEIRSFVNSGQREIIYTDVDADPSKQIYYYRIASLTPCGNVSLVSNYASNILLRTENNGLEHKISWTQYRDWQNGVQNYKIYRDFDGMPVEVATNNPGDLNFNYDISWYVNYCQDKKIHVSNKYCYYVEAIENLGHPITTNTGISRSNVECVFHEPVVWMPNAFNRNSYDSKKSVFRPIISFAQVEPYEFIIFDKWGNEIFKTTQSFDGWNGFLNYDPAPSQYYIYYLRYYDFKNKEHILTGKFFLFAD